MRKLNWTTIALIGGLVLLVLLVAYFATSRNSDQDKLTSNELSQARAPDPEKNCASNATYDLIKRELFRRAAQLRGSDLAAYDKLSAYAVLRMENPVMESEDRKTHAVNCSGSLSLDLPPGVAVVGGRRTLSADIDYTVEPAADGSGMVVLLRNADPIVAPLATLARTAAPAQTLPQPAPPAQVGPPPPPAPSAGTAGVAAQPPPPAPAAPTSPQTPPRPTAAQPSFDCARARTRSEIAVCSDAGLAALDRNMAAQYGRSIASASPQQRALLESTRLRFLRYRDRCPDRACIGDAYVGRMREIRDIMQGTWRSPR